MLNRSIAIVGDYVTDVVFASEPKIHFSEGKETLFSALAPNHVGAAGAGGVTYSQLVFDILLETHLAAIYEHRITSLELRAKIALVTQGLRDFVINQYNNEDFKAWANYQNHWVFAKTPRDLVNSTKLTYRLTENLGRLSRHSGLSPKAGLPLHKTFMDDGPALLLLSVA